MGKIHQVLAVESDLKGKAASIFKETEDVFKKKSEHFKAFTKKYNKLREESDDQPSESKEMVTTVRAKLDWTHAAMANYIDCTYQKEEANQRAKASITLLDGTVIAEDVPAVMLLSLESKLHQLIELYREIPTLEPGRRWTADVNQKNVFVADPITSYRTLKEKDIRVVVPATDRFPAQTAEFTKDVNIGQWTKTDYSGMMTPVEKAALLERADALLAAVKRARCRANDTEIRPVELGKKLFNFLNG